MNLEEYLNKRQFDGKITDCNNNCCAWRQNAEALVQNNDLDGQ